ncbi:unnamed protein product [Tuber aestivum]|uniref:DUF1682 domain protein n=1 Tax=Tuber aestivum TaxID=59557 RepID=A0A292PZE8_9PEZI|nr:unnamed protein product [Tuber aestivum]
MAQKYLGKILGDETKKTESSTASDDGAFSDFADFATPSPATLSPAPEFAAASPLTPISAPSTPTGAPIRFDGPWYALWERHSLDEFQFEGYILLLLFGILGWHFWGTRRNRAIANKFFSSMSPVLSQEFSYVGFDPYGRANTEQPVTADYALKENHPLEFVAYASGRQNVAFMHTTIKLQRRSNPIIWFGEHLFAFFFESVPTPTDNATITISPFDGQDAGKGGPNSKYDNFVWALVNKNQMKRWREDRYDLSLTRTSDWDGLPNWLAVMSENKEIGDTVLTKELKEAVVDCPDILEYLIVSDQPIDKPTTPAETVPKKRVTLQVNIPSDMAPTALPKLLQAFIRLVDHLAAVAHFRPEVLRKVKAVREEEAKKLQKQVDEEKAEERQLKRDEDKKLEREKKLRGMSAEEQKKFLEREREKETRKAMKKQTKK